MDELLHSMEELLARAKAEGHKQGYNNAVNDIYSKFISLDRNEFETYLTKLLWLIED